MNDVIQARADSAITWVGHPSGFETGADRAQASVEGRKEPKNAHGAVYSHAAPNAARALETNTLCSPR
jgi:hypothetical protein